MPWYKFRCTNEQPHEFDRYLTLSHWDELQRCPECIYEADRLICAPLMVSAQEECRYDSPIDGRVITTHAQRQDDLDRHDCVPYDPEMKTDQARREKDGETQLDKQIDETVENAIEKMDSKTRGNLYSELAYQGKDAEYWRGTKEE